MSFASTFFTETAAAAENDEIATTTATATTTTTTTTTSTVTTVPSSVTKMAEALITNSLIAVKSEPEPEPEPELSLEHLTALKFSTMRKTKAESTSCTNNNDNNFDHSKDCLISENETKTRYSPNFKKRRKQTTPIRISNESENESENRDETTECLHLHRRRQRRNRPRCIPDTQNEETDFDAVRDSQTTAMATTTATATATSYSSSTKCNDEDNNENNNEQSNQNNYNNCSYTSEELMAIFHESLQSNLEMCSNKSGNNCDDDDENTLALDDERSKKSNFPNWLADDITGVGVNAGGMLTANETDGGGDGDGGGDKGNQKIASTLFSLYQQELLLKQQSKMQTSASTSSDSSTKHFNPESYCEFCNKEFCNKYFLKTHKANKHKIFKDSTSSEREFEQTFLQTLPKNFLETNATLAAIKREDQFSCSDNSSDGAGETTESLRQLPQQKSQLIKPQEQLQQQHQQQQTSFISMAKKNNHNSDTFCEFCSKEYCNKYFLRTHKLKRHRSSMMSFMSAANTSTEISEIESQVHKQLETLMQTSPLNLMVNSLKAEMQPERRFRDEQEKTFGYAKQEERLSSDAGDNNSIAMINAAENRLQESIGKNLQKLQTMISELNENDLVCNFCKKKYETKNDLHFHLLNEHEHETSIQNISGSLPFQQQQQQQVQKISQRLQRSSLMPSLTPPMQSLNALNTGTDSRAEPTDIPFPNYCRFCDTQFACFEDFKMHPNDCTNTISNLQTNRFPVKIEPMNEEKKSMLTSTPTPTATSSSSINSYCKICQKDLCNKYFMKTHMQRMHNIEIDNGTQIGGVVCDICNKELCSKYFLKVHKNNTHGINDDQPSLSTTAAGLPAVTAGTIMGGGSEAQIQNQLIERLQRALPPEEQLRTLQLQYEQHAANVATFDNASNFYELSTKYHNNFNEVCRICQKRFRNSKWLKIHLMSEHCQAANGGSYGSQSLLAATQPQSLSSILSLKIPSNFSANKSFTTTITGTTTKLATTTAAAATTKLTTLSPKSTTHTSLTGIQYLQKNQPRNYVCSYCTFETKILSLLLAHEKSHLQFPAGPKNDTIATTVTSGGGGSKSLSFDTESFSDDKLFRSNTLGSDSLAGAGKKRKIDNNNKIETSTDLIANIDAKQPLPSSYAFPKLISLPVDNYLMQKFLMYELKANEAKNSKRKRHETDSDTEPAADSDSESERSRTRDEPKSDDDDADDDSSGDRNDIEMCNPNPDQNANNMLENSTTAPMPSFENGIPDDEQPQPTDSDKNQSVLPSIVYLPVFNKISKPITLQISLNPV